MKFSFIIPAYNCGKFLNKCIENIKLCGLHDYEIIIVDDGSTDNSWQVCNSFVENNIIVHHQKNQGVSAARNKGIELASGDYIIFVDADDTLLPFDLYQIESAVKEKVDIIIFGMMFSYIWHREPVKTEILVSKSDGILKFNDVDAVFYDLYQCNYFTPVWNKIFKRDTIVSSNLKFDNRLNNYEDLKFSLDVMSVSDKICVLNKPYYVYNNQYGVDRTPDRIRKIENIFENTDIIAESFFNLNHKFQQKTGKSLPEIETIVYNIYLEIFRHRLKYLKPSQVSKEVSALLKNETINRCVANNPLLKQRKDYIRLNSSSSVHIYLWYLYRRVRHVIADKVKLTLCLLKKKK